MSQIRKLNGSKKVVFEASSYSYLSVLYQAIALGFSFALSDDKTFGYKYIEASDNIETSY